VPIAPPPTVLDWFSQNT